MSIAIRFENVVKRFGDHTVIPGLSLEIKPGEFFTLLGSSGCGKTTLLRMAMGFNSIEEGNIYFNDRRMNDVPPAKRNIGMVFQNYAIFPHMTVEGNVAFGLKQHKVPKEEIRERVDKALRMVHIDDLRDRYPDRISGGQQQRVALARAVVMEPDVLLMDEPLSNLDAKLRVEMRSAIKEIQQKVGITTIYVTHDQEEALAISDRLAVIDHGVIQHAGDPQNVYQHPANRFVAMFIGRTNILDGKITRQNGPGIILGGKYRIPLQDLLEDAADGMPADASVRPEEFYITEDTSCIPAEIQDSVFLGLNTHYHAKLETGEVVDIIQESEKEKLLRPGAVIHLGIKAHKINAFTKDGSKNLIRGVVNDV